MHKEEAEEARFSIFVEHEFLLADPNYVCNPFVHNFLRLHTQLIGPPEPPLQLISYGYHKPNFVNKMTLLHLHYTCLAHLT